MQRSVRHLLFVVVAIALVSTAGGAVAAPTPAAQLSPRGGTSAAADFAVAIERIGEGTITSVPAGINCGTEGGTACSANFPEGTTVTLTARPKAGWAWHFWDGGCRGRTTVTCSFRVTAATPVLVIFAGLEVAETEVVPRWTQSKFSGGIRIDGAVSHAAELTYTVRMANGRTYLQRFSVPTPGGEFTHVVRPPRGSLLPGRVPLHIEAVVTNRRVPPHDYNLQLAAPREGIVSRAWVTALGRRTPVVRLPDGAVGAMANFRFSHLPARGSRIVATWFQGRIKLGSASKARRRVVTSRVGRRGGLPRGFFYKCVLTVNGVVVKETGVRTR